MLRRLPASELVEWEEYSNLEPWGQYRGDLQAGIVASVISNLVRDESQEPWKPGDFVLRFEKSDPIDEKQGADLVLAAWSLFAAGHNAHVRRQEKERQT